jgi:hypothetical protein
VLVNHMVYYAVRVTKSQTRYGRGTKRCVSAAPPSVDSMARA